jgi:WD40 repeat protein
MRALVCLFALVSLLIVGSVSAQDAKGWLGTDVQDVTKAEADKLKWESPHGAKLGVVASGSPAEKAGLKSGDIILSIDRTVIDTSSEVDAAVTAKRPGDAILLQVLSNGNERRVSVTLAERPKIQATAQDQALPVLLLDTAGHMALIRGLAFTPDGKRVVSAGDDKVIRVWDWQAGKTIRTIRGQVAPGDEGKIFAMALSPDGRWLAAGGWLPGSREESDAIRLYDFATGKLAALLKGHTGVVNSLAFSPDSKQLASGGGLGDVSAIIWDVEGRKPLHRLRGHTAEIYALAFTPDGQRVVTGSYDGTLRLWRVADGGSIAELKGHTNKIEAIAVRSSDGMIASGDFAGEIRLWDSNAGRYLRTFGNNRTWVGALVFSHNGQRLLSTCSHGHPCQDRVWDVATGSELATHQIDEGIVLAAAISPIGQFAATGGGNNNEIHLWELATGAPAKGPKGKPLVLAGTGAPGWAVGFSADGHRIAWSSVAHGGGNQLSRLEYQLQLPAGDRPLGNPEPIDQAAAKDFVRARATFGDFKLSHRKGGNFGFDAILDLNQGDRVIASIERDSTDGYDHRAYTFTPDGQSIISGGEVGVLTAYDLKGHRLGDFVGHEGVIWALTPSPDGRLLVSGSHDQTVRLWNLKTRELIVTLFNGADGEWVMWTPQGYYTGSPGADKIVGWQINKGQDQVPDYVGADQLRDHLNRPDIVERAIILASAEAAVHEAQGTTFKLADLLARPVPRFKIISPLADEVQRGGRAVVKIAIEATPDPIKAIRVQVNGREIGDVTPDIGSGGFGAGERMLVVPLARGKNEVRITLTNAIGEKAEALTLNHEGEGALDKRGTLYILAIGVDKYPGLGNTCGVLGDKSCNLTVSGADARALVAAVEKRLGPAHNKIVKRLLINGAGGKDDPTAANILDAIDTLKQAEETDTVLLFIAGHGINEGSNYRFLATNAEWTGDALRGSTVVPWQILQEAVEAAKGRRILFIDTCHSGNAYNQRLGNAAYHANIIAYTAARFDQMAREDDKLGHGLFTYAMVEGLEGKGGIAQRREITTKSLADYVIKRVEELAKGQKASQEPQYFKGRDAEDYVLATW